MSDLIRASDEIKERASCKCFATLRVAESEIQRLEKEIKQNRTGGVSLEQLEGVLELRKIDRDVADYIFKIVELNNIDEE
jgi:hypothetical protein